MFTSSLSKLGAEIRVDDTQNNNDIQTLSIDEHEIGTRGLFLVNNATVKVSGNCRIFFLFFMYLTHGQQGYLLLERKSM